MQQMRQGWLILAFAAALAPACKTPEEVTPGTDVQSVARESFDESASVVAGEESPRLLQGYGFDGPRECLSLADDRTCLGRSDPLEASCAQVQGEVLVCEDCSALCSRELPVRK